MSSVIRASTEIVTTLLGLLGKSGGSGHQGGSLTTVRKTTDSEQAVIFLHGFSGGQDDTWDRFPSLVGTEITDWDIYTLGYATTLLPDVVGVWAADPDIPILATLLRTRMKFDPLERYKSLALIAHSMGGLIVQQALVEDNELARKVQHLILFGTPSGGLYKAWLIRFWKRQFHNMSKNGKFIRNLRAQWQEKFGIHCPFNLLSVAGTKDQFVPPESSLGPFDTTDHYVVPGDHLSIVKPAGIDAESVQMVVSALCSRKAPKATQAPLRVATEEPKPEISQIVADKGDSLSEFEVVEAALGLDRAGKRDESIRLLERYQTLGTDVQGTLAGRIKRVWLESESEIDARRTLDIYEHALDQALANNNHEQIYYHAINAAFLNFVAFDNRERAIDMAYLALRHCEKSPRDVWNLATQAEGNLYLGRRDRALELYRQLPNQEEIEPWQLASTALQASQIARKLDDKALAEEFDAIFSPNSRHVNKIFISYSHKDAKWMERFLIIMKPYLREAETDLDLWVDTRGIQAGDKWFEQITAALNSSGIAVLLVSANFLASEFICDHELPAIIKAAENEGLRLFWISLSSAGYEATPLKDFQASHNISKPLATLSEHEQDQTLLEVARQIKQAALAATERFVAMKPE